MLDWLRDYLQQRAARREAAALSASDLQNIGLTRAEAEALFSMPPEITGRVARMASVYELTRADIRRDGAAYRDLVAGCALCSRVRECGERLADVSQLSPGDVSFCPNSAAFARLASRPFTRRAFGIDQVQQPWALADRDPLTP
jgi:hypothetical protein